MKFTFCTIFTAAILSVQGATPPVNFENGKIDGVQIYRDRESGKPPRPEISRDEILSGNCALKISFAGCKKYQGFHFHRVPPMPEGATAISFLIKPLYGPPPTTLALGEVVKRYDKPLLTVTCPLPINGSDWQKITIPFNELRPGRRTAGNSKFTAKPGTLYLFTLYGAVSDQPSAFLLDDITWELE